MCHAYISEVELQNYAYCYWGQFWRKSIISSKAESLQVAPALASSGVMYPSCSPAHAFIQQTALHSHKLHFHLHKMVLFSN